MDETGHQKTRSLTATEKRTMNMTRATTTCTKHGSAKITLSNMLINYDDDPYYRDVKESETESLPYYFCDRSPSTFDDSRRGRTEMQPHVPKAAR
jgi:hypothetical protein